jgi:hypothetical protein
VRKSVKKKKIGFTEGCGRRWEERILSEFEAGERRRRPFARDAMGQCGEMIRDDSID